MTLLPSRFDVSLLTASNAVYVQAVDCFFEVNTIRLWQHSELDYGIRKGLRYTSFVRHLELVNLDASHEFLTRDGDGLRETIEACKAFPKLKSLTTAYDGLVPQVRPWLESQNLDQAEPGSRGSVRGRWTLRGGSG